MKIRLTTQTQSQHHPGVLHEAGAEGIIVEALDENTSLVEIRVPDETLEGDAWYDVLDLPNDTFEVVEDALVDP